MNCPQTEDAPPFCHTGKIVPFSPLLCCLFFDGKEASEPPFFLTASANLLFKKIFSFFPPQRTGAFFSPSLFYMIEKDSFSTVVSGPIDLFCGRIPFFLQERPPRISVTACSSPPCKAALGPIIEPVYFQILSQRSGRNLPLLFREPLFSKGKYSPTPDSNPKRYIEFPLLPIRRSWQEHLSLPVVVWLLPSQAGSFPSPTKAGTPQSQTPLFPGPKR